MSRRERGPSAERRGRTASIVSRKTCSSTEKWLLAICPVTSALCGFADPDRGRRTPPTVLPTEFRRSVFKALEVALGIA